MKKKLEIERKIQTTKLHEINYAFQRNVSYSQFSIYQQCPHRWSLENVFGKKEYKPTIHTVFGTAIHETVQEFIKTIYNISGAAGDRLDLSLFFQDRFRNTYQKEYEKTKVHFSSAAEMREFYDDGIEIINYIQKNRNKLFTIRNVRLLGIELPIVQKLKNNLYLSGYIDYVLYDEDLKKITIFDLKTSTRGWYDKDKKDEIKISQILLYKEYLAKQYTLDIDSIDVEFIILRRKIDPEAEYPISRVQSFKPASGKGKRAKLKEKWEAFLADCFTDNGEVIRKDYLKVVGEASCKWCPFNNDNNLCNKINGAELPSPL